MNKKMIASELVKIAKGLMAGSQGKFSGDASDVFEAIVLRNKGKSESAIIALVKKDEFLMSEIEEMNITDKELKEYIKDTLLIFGK